MTTTTTKTITHEQINALRAEAYTAGDYAMGAICDLALTGRFDADDYSVLERDDTRRIAGMSRDDAYAACAEALNTAAAMDD